MIVAFWGKIDAGYRVPPLLPIDEIHVCLQGLLLLSVLLLLLDSNFACTFLNIVRGVQELELCIGNRPFKPFFWFMCLFSVGAFWGCWWLRSPKLTFLWHQHLLVLLSQSITILLEPCSRFLQAPILVAAEEAHWTGHDGASWGLDARDERLSVRCRFVQNFWLECHLLQVFLEIHLILRLAFACLVRFNDLLMKSLADLDPLELFLDVVIGAVCICLLLHALIKCMWLGLLLLHDESCGDIWRRFRGVLSD